MNVIEEYHSTDGKIAYIVAEFNSDTNRLVYHIKLYNNGRKHKFFYYRDSAERWLAKHKFTRAFN